MKWKDIWSSNIRLKPNDKIFTYGSGGISGAIRKIEGLLDEKHNEKSIANHVGVISEVHYLDSKDFITNEPKTVAYINILEALFPFFKENSLGKYDDGKTEVLIVRDITNTDVENLRVVAYIRKNFLGKLYNIPAIVAQFVDNFIEFFIRRKFNFFSKMNILKLPICSRAVAVADKEVLGKTYGVNAYAATPDDMLDYILEHLNKKFAIIFATDKMVKMLEIQISGSVSIDI